MNSFCILAFYINSPLDFIVDGFISKLFIFFGFPNIVKLLIAYEIILTQNVTHELVLKLVVGLEGESII